MQINLNLEEILTTETGQEIAKQAFIQAFKEQAAQYFYSEYALANICSFLVEKYVNIELEPLKSKIKQQVEVLITSEEPIKYFSQNKVLNHLIDNTIREQSELVKSQVIKKLQDDSIYESVTYSIGEAVVNLLKESK